MKNAWLKRTLFALIACGICAFGSASSARAQGTRKDDVVFGPQGRPVGGALVAICTQPANATTTPCSPLAGIFSDAALTQALANPLKTDGLGNYHFYAAPGKYTVQVYGPGLTTSVIPDVILPNDPMNPTVSSITTSGGVSAFSLTLNGNLTVGGNANVTGSLSTGSFNPSAISTNTLSVKGPQPRVDVTAYGAKGDGSTNDTAAIQAAINAACVTGGGVYFPPAQVGGGFGGAYSIRQPQLPSTSPVFTIPANCQGLYLSGGNSYQGTANAFSRAPQTRIIVQPGASPNLAPVFLINQTSITLENLAIDGYNQAVQIQTADAVLNNVSLAAVHTGQPLGGFTDNTPLAIYNSFWVWVNQGSLLVANPNDYAVVMAQVAGPGQNNMGLFRFERITTTGSFLVDNRATVTSPIGNLEFHTVATETSANPFLTFTQSTGSGISVINGINLDDVDDFDCAGSLSTPLVAIKAPYKVEDIHMFYPASCGATAPAIQLFNVSFPGAAVDSVHIDGGVGGIHTILDENGNIIGDAVVSNTKGWEFYTNTSDANRLRTDFKTLSSSTVNGIAGNGFDGTPIRMVQAGKTQASLGVDPAQGLLLADGTNSGYSASISQSMQGAIDFNFAAAMPPTNVTATPTTGGTCAAGTYFYKIVAFESGGTVMSSPALEVESVLAGANNATLLAWTPSLGSNVAGYFIYRNNAGAMFFGTQTFYTVNGQSSSSFTDSCAAGSSGPPQTYNATLTRTNRLNNLGNFDFSEGTCGTPLAGHDILCGNDVSHQLQLSNNGGAFTAIGSGGGTSLAEWISQPNTPGVSLAPSAANAVNVSQIVIPYSVTVSKIVYDVGTVDGANNYDIGIYDSGGALKCDIGAQTFGTGGVQDKLCTQGSVTLPAGIYYFAFTGAATTAKIFYGNSSALQVIGTNTSGSSTGGALPASITVPGVGAQISAFGSPFIILH
jgi:Pectate lyase superfamily protein